MDEEKDVEVDATEDSSPEAQEDQIDSEVVENTDPVSENLKRALQKERARRKSLEAQLQTPKAQEVSEDDTVRRFLNVEATTLINNKLLTDPAFRDRVDLVQDEMKRTGKQLEDADNAVLARLFQEMALQGSNDKVEQKSLNKLPNTAIPEETPKVSKETQEELDMFDAMKDSFGK